MTDKIVVLVTCGSRAEAKRIAKSLVETRLAACVNILRAPIASVYRWNGKVESATETLLVIKTARSKFPALERAIKRMHGYDVPEIIALPIAAGSSGYLVWLSNAIERR